MPFSMRTVSWVGEPSSSTLSEPRRPVMVPLSTTETLPLATGWPTRPAKAEVFFAVEVGFEAVAYGFMEQDAGPAGAKDDFHLAGGGGDGAELQDGSASGFTGEALGALGANEDLQSTASAATSGAAGGVLIVFGDDEDVEPAERLGVGGVGAIGADNEDATQLFTVAGADLMYMRAESASGAVGALDEVEAGGEVEVIAAEGNGIEVGGLGVLEAVDRLLRRAGGDERGGLGGVEQALGTQVIGVGVAGALAGEDADAAAGAGALAGGLDDLLIDTEGDRCDRLEIEVGVISAGGERFAEAAF